MHDSSPALVFALGTTAVLHGRAGVDDLHHLWTEELSFVPGVEADPVFGSTEPARGFGELIGMMRADGIDTVRLAPPSPLGPLGMPRLGKEDRRRLLGRPTCVAETDREARAVIGIDDHAVRVHACAPIRYGAGAATVSEAARQLRESVLAALLHLDDAELGHELRAWQESAAVPGAVEFSAPLERWFATPEHCALAALALRLSETAGQLVTSPMELPPGSPLRDLSQAAAEALLAATRP